MKRLWKITFNKVGTRGQIQAYIRYLLDHQIDARRKIDSSHKATLLIKSMYSN